MLYFNNLPNIAYPDGNGKTIIMKDLMTRVYVISKLAKDPLMFYSYDVKEGETPEIVAYKYYGSVDDFWLVLLANKANDPEWDWPLTHRNLEKYIIEKYGSIENSQQLHHYEKIITVTNPLTNESEQSMVKIGSEQYANVIVESTTCSFPLGDVIYSVDKREVTNYMYENELNESRRNINLIDKTIALSLQREFRRLYGLSLS
jgi:hypothetical protein